KNQNAGHEADIAYRGRHPRNRSRQRVLDRIPDAQLAPVFHTRINQLMANISQTAANVAVGASTTPTRLVQFGEAVTQGQPLYQHTDGKYYQCDANDGVAKALAAVIALTP